MQNIDNDLSFLQFRICYMFRKSRCCLDMEARIPLYGSVEYEYSENRSR